MTKFKGALATAAAFLAAGPALAHHSFSMFDAQKTLSIEGTVKEFELVNPHGWLYVVAKDADGKTVEWGIEMGGPGALGRNGWKPDTVKPGDKIVVQIHPLKDGTYGGQFLNAKLADGRTIGGGDTGLPPALR
jgi:hypothetical protein